MIAQQKSISNSLSESQTLQQSKQLQSQDGIDTIVATTTSNTQTPNAIQSNTTHSSPIMSMKSSTTTLKQINNNNNNHRKSLVRRVSYSLEKGMFQLLANHQDWNILHNNNNNNRNKIDEKESATLLKQATKNQSNSSLSKIAEKLMLNHSANDLRQSEPNTPNKKQLNELKKPLLKEDSLKEEEYNYDDDDENKSRIKKNIEEVEETPLVNSKKKINKSSSDEPHFFIEEAIRELLRSRRILGCSYVYGFYLDTFGHKKFIFELIQTEFEECTENLSQVIARPHLKTPKNKIIRLTNMLKRKRVEFLDTIVRGLNSFNETPPTLKKYSRQRWKYLLKDNIQNEDEFKNTIALSIKELNPKNPWIIDKKGRHTNLFAMLNDWPELENDLESILTPSKDKNGLCAKWDCGKVRAVNTLSGSLCNYCSIRCMKIDHLAYMEQKKNAEQQNQLNKEQMRSIDLAKWKNAQTKSKNINSPTQTLADTSSKSKDDDEEEEENNFDMGFKSGVENAHRIENIIE